jgi:hypothetical protein
MTETQEIKGQSDATIHAVQTKVLRFPELHSGDDQQDNGTLTFHSDGTGTWSCTTLTYHTHTGDVWHASFDVKGSNGATLFHLGTYNSPRMNDGNPPPKYSWSVPFAFQPDFYNAISRATQHYSA